jgi:hypothetical protein
LWSVFLNSDKNGSKCVSIPVPGRVLRYVIVGQPCCPHYVDIESYLPRSQGPSLVSALRQANPVSLSDLIYASYSIPSLTWAFCDHELLLHVFFACYALYCHNLVYSYLAKDVYFAVLFCIPMTRHEHVAILRIPNGSVTLCNAERIILCCVFPFAASTFLLCTITLPARSIFVAA